MNSKSKLAAKWTLKLSPKSDAWDISPVKDQHNVWRNNPAGITRLELPESIPATVPGCIHTDLMSAGLIKDISIDGKEQDQFWIWKTDSQYSTVIKQDTSPAQKHLVFQGLDTIATIELNDNVILTTKNMHRSYRLDVTEILAAGDLSLKISFAAPLSDAESKLAALGTAYPRPYEMPYNYQRKMACSYGWDWGPITISSGIWKPILLHTWSDAYLENTAITSTLVNGVPHLTAQVRCAGGLSGKRISVSVKSKSGEVVAQSESTVAGAQTNLEFAVPNAQIWHPRGRGAQPLYDVEISLVAADGTTLEDDSKQTGFRLVELDTSESAPGKNHFAIKVNGERLWIRGANWIPDDPFPTRVTRERYHQRIKDMLEANINGIRVWGGGIYESDDFYELCDQEGIVVWQDFLFACAAYPEIPEMFEEVEAEVDENVRRLAGHPSLVIWNGGNECIEGFQYWGWQEGLEGRPWGETFYLQTIPNTLKKIDNTRPYIPGSPFSTHSDNVKSFDSGTIHIWDVWNETGYERYEQYSPSFAAEFGFNGPGSWSMLTRAIGSDDLVATSDEVAYHQRAFDGMSKIAAGLSREFANPPTRGHAWYFAAALGQARAVEIGLKHFRSLYETCSGAILWQFNDMWPAISWAVLDYTGFRKLAWHAMKSAYQPRAIVVGRVDQGAQITLLNDLPDPWQTKVVLSLIDKQGSVVKTHTIDVNLDRYSVSRTPATEIFPEIADGNYEGFILATCPEVRASRRTTLSPAQESPKHDLVASAKISAGRLTVEVKANTYIHEISFMPELLALGTQVDSQIVSLLAGETHTFKVTGESKDLEAISQRIDDLLWSHNRIVNQ